MSSIRQIATLMAIIATLTIGTCEVVQAGKYKVLHSFCESSHGHPCGDGTDPQGGLAMDAAGNLFGVTANGEAEFGTVFELERKDSGGFNFKTIYRFCQGGFCGTGARSPLIIDTSGNLYGTADNLVFELSPQADKKSWVETVLYRFCSQQNCTDGNSPIGKLTYVGASTGVLYDGSAPLYGVTNGGGANERGVSFSLSLNGGHWTETVLYNFCSVGSECRDGAFPVAGPIIDAEGNLFGTTQMGGGNNLDGNSGGAGTVYALQNNGASWTEVVLHSFCSAAQCADGAYPFGTIKLGADSKFLGVTAVGGGKCDLNGILGCGVLFKLTNNGENSIETVLHTFCVKKNCKDGAEPVSTPALDASGNFLGTTNLGGGNNIDRFGQGGGVVYRLSGDAFDYKLLHSFCSTANCADGEYPEGEVVIDPDGDFIGTTSLGGLNGSDTEGGTVFSLRTAP